VNPDLAKEWHPKKNKNLKPVNITPGSSKKVWWLCKYSHEWQAPVLSRKNGSGCPICRKKIHATPGYNLAVVNPDLAKEWHPTRNNNLKPEDVIPKSPKKVWWLCKYAHEWQWSVFGRNKGSGCPKCTRNRATPQYNLAVINPGLAKEWNPGKNGALTPENVTPSSRQKVWWLCKAGHEWQAAIYDRHRGSGCNVCSRKGVEKGYIRKSLVTPQYNLAVVNPDLAKEWHPTKNRDLKPENITPGSKKEVWWQCKNGHEWKTAVIRRKKYGCLKCYLNKATPEYNLAVVKPKLVKEWHPVKNKGLSPAKITPGSSKKVWWLCEEGHEWIASVSDRNRGSGCPECSRTRKRVTPEHNLAVKNPALAKEWNLEKNGRLTPGKVAPNSNKKVWWICDKGHEWKASIGTRNKGRGCPWCGKRLPSPEYNFAVVNPAAAQEWHPVKNKDLSPRDVTPGSTRKVWWRCKNGHEWMAKVTDRNRKSGCPICYRNFATPENNLALVNPDLAKEWHTIKNNDLTPAKVTPGSSKRVWWQCKKGHEWEAQVAARHLGHGCPYCKNRKVSADNNLAVVNPELAKEWHPTKNGDLTPEKVIAGGTKRVWWQCKNGHEWMARLFLRNKGTACPVCSRLNRNQRR
ncbi:MAG: zinc-ribbon domain-containing protein, partial [Candidatus Aminicenantes bacterium]